MQKKDPKRAAEILQLLTVNGGNRSGVAIGAVDWAGNVYIDQFTRHLALGNVGQQSFKDIWQNADNVFLQELRERKLHIKGRCRTCKWLGQCNGNFRARGLSSGDFWAADPACYFTDQEIAE